MGEDAIRGEPGWRDSVNRELIEIGVGVGWIGPRMAERAVSGTRGGVSGDVLTSICIGVRFPDTVGRGVGEDIRLRLGSGSGLGSGTMGKRG